MNRKRQAIQALQRADDAFAAYQGPEGTTEYQRLHKAVEAAYNNPDLPDRHRDPRDRKNAHKIRCRCTRPRSDADGYCETCGCRT